MYSLINISKSSIVCRASPKSNANNKKFFTKTRDAIKQFNKKRTDVAKENFNKLVAISQQEVQEINDFIKELDTLHRDQFEEIKQSFKNNNITEDETVQEDENEENIFEEKSI